MKYNVLNQNKETALRKIHFSFNSDLLSFIYSAGVTWIYIHCGINKVISLITSYMDKYYAFIFAYR